MHLSGEKIVSAGCRNQRAGSLRSPEEKASAAASNSVIPRRADAEGPHDSASRHTNFR